MVEDAYKGIYWMFKLMSKFSESSLVRFSEDMVLSSEVDEFYLYLNSQQSSQIGGLATKSMQAEPSSCMDLCSIVAYLYQIYMIRFLVVCTISAAAWI